MCILNVVGQHVRIGSKQRRQSLRLYLDDIAINATIRHWPVPHHPHFLSQLQKTYLHLRNGSLSSMYHCNMCLTNCTLIQIPLVNHPLSILEPRTYWIVNESRFPILTTMARDILSIPAMSSEVERVFS